MTIEHKKLIHALLKGIETGDEVSVAVVNPDMYIQHNPQTQEGGEGLAALFKRLSKTSPRVNIARIFTDADFVFAHTEYDFNTRRIGFEVFRFVGDQTVEHWDNIQLRLGPNLSGHSMVDGPVEASDHANTEANRQLVSSFVKGILINHEFEELGEYFDSEDFTEHSPYSEDSLAALRTSLSETMSDGEYMIRYQTVHRVLAEGNFVLAVSEGFKNGIHTSFYDLFRISKSRLVEHWSTTEGIPPQSEWKNENGKF